MFDTVRNYLSEFRNTVTNEWKLFQKFGISAPDPESSQHDIDFRRLLASERDYTQEQSLTQEYSSHFKDTYYGYVESDHMKGEPFEFYHPIDSNLIPDSRLSSPGITTLPFRYHKQQVVSATRDVPESGFQLHPLINHLLMTKYPEYLAHVRKYCRPLGTTDATFSDFNKEQKEYPAIPPDIISRIVPLITFFLNAKKFLPLHYVDTFFCKMPLSTGTSYYYRHSYELRTHAAFSHDQAYHNKQSSKGYFLNAFTQWARTTIHRIKLFGTPFTSDTLSPSEIKDKLKQFFLEHSTMLFTRNHISDRDGALKQRPVYAMDTLFLHLECMLTFPLHVLARSTSSSIMYSMETIRGGCAQMDSLSRRFTSFLCIDWSSYDQRMPFSIIDTFFTTFLPSLIVIDKGYQPTSEYLTYPGLSSDKLYSRLFNVLCFIRTWYFNCVYTTADGFSYVRQFAGVASGMLNTQYLDSYCNLFLLIHALIHFGCSDSDILQITFFVMGDDNVLLTDWPIMRLHSFLSFLTDHSLSRFGMVLSPTKSIITTLRSRIEMLGYSCNHGHPKRPIPKLVAQLCYPEHGPVDKFMSSRAVGLAYASAGCDPLFYTLCKDVYFTFLPYAETPTPQDMDRIMKHLPGFFKLLDSVDDFVNIERFPTIYEIRSRYSQWQGELDISKKWSPAHFPTLPGEVSQSSMTMTDYMTHNGLVFPDVDRLF
jgi:hypothetical protein